MIEETAMPQGSILQKITRWPSSCTSSAPCQALAINVTKWNITQFASYYFPWLIWLDTQESHKNPRQSQKYLQKGLITAADSYLHSNIFAFQEGARMIFCPQTTLILTFLCILISIKIQTHQFSFGERSCGWQDHYSQGIMRTLRVSCWHPRLDFHSALRSSTNKTWFPKRLWTSHLYKCPRPRVSYASTDIYIIKHTTSISKQNKLQRHKPV